jgi:hypothetical protein
MPLETANGDDRPRNIRQDKAEAMAAGAFLNKADRVQILRLVVDYARGRYILAGASDEPNVDLDALARDSPETLAAIAAIARERRAELNEVARPR